MAAAFVQGTGVASVGSVASVSKAFDSPTTAGNAIAVGGVASINSLTTTSVSDGTNTYSQAIYQEDVAAGHAACGGWYALNIAGGSMTVTLDPTGSDFVSIGIAEASGVATSSAIDGTGFLKFSTTPYTTSSWNPTDDGILFGCFEQNGTATTINTGAGFTQIFEDENATNAMPIHFQYKLTTGTASVNSTWTLLSDRGGVDIGFSLKQGAASAGTVCHLSTTGGWVF